MIARESGRTHFSLATAALLTSLFLVAAQAEELRPATASTSDLIAKGDQQWAAGRLDDAQKIFEQALIADPRSVVAHMKLGGLQLSRNDFNGCIQTYQHVIGLDPDNTRAWIGLGISYLHTGRNALSRAAFDEVIRIEPKRREQLASVMSSLKPPD